MKTHFCKGQSAIEYLTTYGWMLLVVAIVGGSIYTTVSNQGQIQSTSGLANADVQVADFGVTEQGFQAELRAGTSDQIENVNFTLIDPETGETVSKEATAVPVGDTETVSLDGVESSESTNTYDVKIEYDSGGLEDLEEEGTITAQIEINTGSSNSSDGNSDDNSLQPISVAHSSAPDCSTISYNGSGTSGDPYEVTNDWQLQCITNNLSADYELTQNINASGTESWNYNSTENIYKGFKSINLYEESQEYNVELSGNYYAVTGLYINRTNTDEIGFISSDADNEKGNIVNLSLTDVYISGQDEVGAVLGDHRGIKIKNISISGEIKGNSEVGGAVGVSAGVTCCNPIIRLVETNVTVIGDSDIGGVAGFTTQGAAIYESYSEGKVIGGNNVGGIVGDLIVGVGGPSSYIHNSYSLADVEGNDAVGGLVGRTDRYYSITSYPNQSFSAGSVEGSTNVGGLVGVNNGEVIDSYWDVPASGQDTSPGGTGIGSLGDSAPAGGMVGDDLNQSFENDLDFQNTWRKVSSPDDYPELQWQ